jgi:transcriptional regulator with XRE-family HTH domain
MASGIGEQLRAARRAQGIKLEAVEERLRIRGRFLRAMEEEQWELLPGAAYARAFLHTYAEYLDLDADAILEQYDGTEESPEPEPAAEPVRQIAIDDRRRPGLDRHPADGRRLRWTIAGVAAAAVLGVLLVLGLTGGSDEGGGRRAAKAGAGSGEGSAKRSKTERTSPQTPPSSVTLRLTATGSVWVCMVNANGRAVVDGVTLPAGEEEGPFRGESFDVTFGNGQVEMEANDEAVSIPAAANPLGYRVTPDGARQLDSSARPTCT